MHVRMYIHTRKYTVRAFGMRADPLCLLETKKTNKKNIRRVSLQRIQYVHSYIDSTTQSIQTFGGKQRVWVCVTTIQKPFFFFGAACCSYYSAFFFIYIIHTVASLFSFARPGTASNQLGPEATSRSCVLGSHEQAKVCEGHGRCNYRTVATSTNRGHRYDRFSNGVSS